MYIAQTVTFYKLQLVSPNFLVLVNFPHTTFFNHLLILKSYA